MKRVDYCSARLADQAKICGFQRQKYIHEGQKDLVSLFSKSSRAIDVGFSTVSAKIDNISRAQLRVLNTIFGMLESTPQQINKPRPSERICLEPETVEGSRGILDAPDFSYSGIQKVKHLRSISDSLVGYADENIPGKDTDALYSLCDRLSIRLQNRAVILLKSSALRGWIEAAASTALLVNGRMSQSDADTRRSPISFICAKLAKATLESPFSATSAIRNSSNTSVDSVTFTLRWFCGEHTNMATDADAHPTGMLYSFVTQFLTQILALKDNIETTFDHEPLQAEFPLEEYDLAATLKLFIALILSLPPQAIVFCIVDGISYYEDEERSDELRTILQPIRELIQEADCLIKLLMTAPIKSYIASTIFEAETLDLPEFVSNEGGFAALEWDTLIGSAIA